MDRKGWVPQMGFLEGARCLDRKTVDSRVEGVSCRWASCAEQETNERFGCWALRKWRIISRQSASATEDPYHINPLVV